MSSPLFKLNNNQPIEALGFGTYKVAPKDAGETLKNALAVGYRHIDTAQMYGNEAAIGDALVEAAVPRASLFLTTKLNNPNHAADRARDSFAQSLRDLKTDYVDLFLMHWPLPNDYGGDYPGTYRVMEEFVADGRARAIGVSNFHVKHLERLLAETSIVPAVNQIELHPQFGNREVVEFCREHGIAIESWSPLGRAQYFDNPVITEIAAAREATPAQVVLAWHRQQGFIAIPKASGLARQKENFDSLRVTLDAGEMDAISALDKGEEGRIGPHPDNFGLN
ncbi:MAG: aldo/keto reductase [Actinomycetaceae bacterium]|nr:aldo/keto reductase [Actinomycetaceae bacterium]